MTGPMATARMDGTAILLTNGTVLMVGGSSGNGPLSSAEIFDPGSGSWSSVAYMAFPREGATAHMQNDGTVLVQGGTSDPDAVPEVFTPGMGTWSSA